MSKVGRAMNSSIPPEVIQQKIFLMRSLKVILDRDLAFFYGVETKYLKRQVKRHLDRFPSDFMFKFTKKEFNIWRCRFVTSNSADKMGLRYVPYAFTEHGILMLSSVLQSDRAVQVNIAIMRAFVKLREFLSTHKELALKLKLLEGKIEKHDGEIQAIFDAIRKLMAPPPEPPIEEKPRKRMGFITEGGE